jgi:hypothetical protein
VRHALHQLELLAGLQLVQVADLVEPRELEAPLVGR